MSNTQVTNSSPHWSIPFSILDLKAQAVRLPVSRGAQILLSELLTWSGEKGYCWWSVPRIAADLGWSPSAVWRRSTELKQAGLLAVIPRPGRTNYWIPLPGSAKMERLKRELTPLAESRAPFLKENEKSLKRSAVDKDCTSTEEPLPLPEPQNDNAIQISSSLIKTTIPQPLPVLSTPEQPDIPTSQTDPTTSPKYRPPVNEDPDYLIEEIERLTNDTHSRSAFRQIVSRVPEQTLFQALSATRLAMAESSIYKPGGYFIGVIRALCPEFQFKRTMKASPPGPPVEERLLQLQSKYPLLKIESLFDRYITLKCGGPVPTGHDEPVDSGYWLCSYEKFLATHHAELYDQKPQYRREVEV